MCGPPTTKGTAVTATAVAPSVTPATDAVPRSWAHGARVVLAAVAIVVLLAVAFVLGRTTATSAHTVTRVVHTPVVTPTTSFCRLGRPC